MCFSGHQLVPFHIPDMRDVVNLFIGGVTADKGTVNAGIVNNDLRCKVDHKWTYLMADLPTWVSGHYLLSTMIISYYKTEIFKILAC